MIVEKGTLIFRDPIGDSELDGKIYSVSRGSSTHTPHVQSETTGRTYVFTWEELVKIAILAGIDEEPDLDLNPQPCPTCSKMPSSRKGRHAPGRTYVCPSGHEWTVYL